MRFPAFIAASTILLVFTAGAADVGVKNNTFQEWDTARKLPANWATGAAPDSYSMERDCEARGSRCVLRVERAKREGYVPLGQSIPAAEFTGKSAKLSGMIRTRDVNGYAGLWVRIDAGNSMLSLDNMEDRGPRATSDWQRFEVILPVPTDATRIAFGVLLVGSGTAWFDELRMEEGIATPGLVRAAIPADFGPVQVDAVIAFARLSGAVRYFHPGDAAQRVNWDRFLDSGSSRMLAVTDRARIGPELDKLFTPWAVGLQIADTADKLSVRTVDDSDAVQWVHLGFGKSLRQQQTYQSGRTHRDGSLPSEPELAAAVRETPAAAIVDLGGGWWASVPLKLSSASASVDPAAEKAIAEMQASFAQPSGQADRAESIAAGIAAWSFARHFYPYWPNVKSDWNEALRAWIAAQPRNQTRAQLVQQLGRLTAAMSDGHVVVYDQRLRRQIAYLPFAVRKIGDRWIVEASAIDEVKPGDVVTVIDGHDIGEVMTDRMARFSGSPQWRAWRAGQDLAFGEKDSSLDLEIERDGKLLRVAGKRTAREPARASRPDNFSQLRDGIWYIDISRYDAKAFADLMPRIASGKAVIFDLRGYPKGAAQELPAYWIDKAEATDWMFVPLVTAPFSTPTRFRGFGWNVEPRPQLQGVRKFLLVDARAISFSESLTGYFASQGTGTIVGEPTAGANGNVVTIQLPGGYAMSMTGMRVTRHDGSVMQGNGFVPDVIVTPTAEGIRAGRDEVLERAIELAQKAGK